MLVDAPCVKCGYNLRMQSHAARCPECAAAVADSLHAHFLRFAPATWVRSVAQGLTLISIAVGLVAAFWALSATVSGLGNYLSGAATVLAGSLACSAPLIGLAALVTTIVGCVKFSARDPQYVLRREPFLTARRNIRRSLWLLLLPIAGFGVLVGFTIWVDKQSPERVIGVVGSGWFWVAWTAGMIVCSSGYVILPLAVMRHLRGLMRRVPAPGLARSANVLYWIVGLLAGLMTLGFAALCGFLVPIVIGGATSVSATAGTGTIVAPGSAATTSGPVRVTISSPTMTATAPTVFAPAPTSAPAPAAAGPGAAWGVLIVILIGFPMLLMFPVAFGVIAVLFACRRRMSEVAAEAAQIEEIRSSLRGDEGQSDPDAASPHHA